MVDVFPRSGMIKIGKQGENRAIRIILPNIRAGSGSILLLHQRALDKKPYLGLSEASTDDERKTALVKYFTAKPCRVVYRIATPIETPLNPAEIAAYKALTTYAPNTVVQASDGTGLKLGYQRDVNIVIKNLEDAIASMT